MPIKYLNFSEKWPLNISQFFNKCGIKILNFSLKIKISFFSSTSPGILVSFGSDKQSQFQTAFNLMDWLWVNDSQKQSPRGVPRKRCSENIQLFESFSWYYSSRESSTNLKTSSFPHFLFPRFNIWIEKIISIWSSLSSAIAIVVMSDKESVPLLGGVISVEYNNFREYNNFPK